MGDTVDILVPSWKSLPWLRLQWNSIRRFPLKVPINYIVWDNEPSPASERWIRDQGFLSRSSTPPKSHPASLEELVKISSSPILAFMDADCIPIKEGWLDEAVSLVKVPYVGAVGLFSEHGNKKYRPFVHPSFCVFRREVYEDLRLSVHPLGLPDGTYFDVCSLMSSVLEHRGFQLKKLGDAFTGTENLSQRVFHFWGSSKGTVGMKESQEPDRKRVMKRQLDCLSDLGFLGEFVGIVRECLPDNPLLAGYLGE